MPLKVLMFGWELPPYNSGGLGTACFGLTQALSQQDVEITFVLPQKVKVKADFMRLEFADIDGFSWPDFSVYDTQKILPDADPGMVRDLVEAAMLYSKRAAAIAKKYKYDLVHAHDWLCFPAGIAAVNYSGTPMVSHVHATEFDRSGGSSGNPVVHAIEQKGMQQSDAVITLSQFMKKLLVDQYSVQRDRVDIVHNGINMEEYDVHYNEDNPLQALKDSGFKIVLFLGRLTLQKGPDYFLKTAQKVLQYNPKTIFLMAGSGDMENQLINMAINLGISDKVLFAGFLRGKLMHQAYDAADLFVMPSVSEPFGLVALESVAHGTPAIISKQSGVSETLGHVLKVDFWDVDEMANQILAVLRHPSLQKSLTDNGKKEVRNVSWDKAAAKTIDVYKKVLNKKPKARS